MLNFFIYSSEAEYAFQLKKDTIPLMLEPNYQPDGWLGLVVGAKFWVDFTITSMINESITKLLKEVGGRGRAGNEIMKAIDALDAGSKHAFFMFYFNPLLFISNSCH